jgi:hypothetical protein
MPFITLFLDGDGCWQDMKDADKEGRLIEPKGPIGLALLEGGMLSGKPSVGIRIDLPDGRVLFTQTSLALLSQTVRAMEAKAGVSSKGE